MGNVSKESAEESRDLGIGREHTGTIEGYTVNFVTLDQDADLAPMLASLPGGHCSCPHWGYLFEGSMTVRYGDHEETIEAGDAFYLPPGHVPKATAGTTFVQFSPAEELAVTEAAIAAAMS